MPKETTPAPIGTIPFVKTTAGVAEWTPISEAVTDAVPENSTVYVSPTGNDVTGTGTALLPFATLPRAIQSLGSTGYEQIGRVIVLGSLTIAPNSILDLAASGPGAQTYPIVIQSSTSNIADSSTVQLVTTDTVTGLWTLTSVDPIFAASDVGSKIVFTSGALSTYQKDAYTAPTSVSAFISGYISPSEVTLSYRGTTLPTVGDSFNMVDNGSLLTFQNPGTSLQTTASTNKLHFDNIDIILSNSGAGSMDLEFLGEVIMSGVRLITSGGTSLLMSKQITTTWQEYSTSVTVCSNNLSGVFIEAIDPLTFGAELNEISLINSCLSTDSNASLRGVWSLTGCCSLGNWSLSGGNEAKLSYSDLDFSNTLGGVAMSGNRCEVSSCLIRNSSGYGFYCSGGTVAVQETTFENNASQVYAVGGASGINFELCSWVAGPNTYQVFGLVDGALISVQGSVSTSTQDSGGSLSESPISLTNGAELYLTGNLTITGSPLRGCYMEGYSKLQCSNLTLTCTAQTGLTLDGGASIDCGGLSVTSGGTAVSMDGSDISCTGLTVNSTSPSVAMQVLLGSSIVVNGDLTLTATTSTIGINIYDKSQVVVTGNATISALESTVSIQTSSTLSCNDFSSNTTASVGANTYIANYSTCNIRGNLVINARGDQGLTLTFGGLMTATTATITGTGLDTGVLANNRGSGRFSTLNIVATAVGLDIAGCDIVVTGALAVNGTTTGIGIRQRSASSIRTDSIAVNQTTTAHDVEDSIFVTAAGYSVINSGTGLLMVSSQADVGTTLSITTSTGTAMDMQRSSRLSSLTSTITSTGPGVTTVLLDSISSFTTTSSTITSASNAVTTTASNFLSSGAVTLNASSGVGINGFAGTFAARGTFTINQQGTSGFQGTSVVASAMVFNSTAGGGCSFIGCDVTTSGGMTFSTTSGNAFTNSDVKVQGNLIGITTTILSSNITVNGSATFTSPTGTAVLIRNSKANFNNISATTTVAGAIACRIEDSTVNFDNNLTTIGSTNGIRIADSNVTCSNVTANNCTTTGITVVGSNVRFVDMLANNCLNGIFIDQGSIITASALSTNNCTDTGLSIGGSQAYLNTISSNSTLRPIRFNRGCDVTVAGAISATKATGDGNISLEVVSGRFSCNNLDVSITAGTATNSTIRIEDSTATCTTVTCLNSGTSALAIEAESQVKIATFNSTNVNGGQHINCQSSTLTIQGGTITGGTLSTTSGILLQQASKANITGITIDNPGLSSTVGVRVSGANIRIANTIIRNCLGSAILTTGALGSIATVSGTGNGQYGVQATGATNITSSTNTVTGTLGDVLLGARGVKTWANIATGQSQHVSDYNSNATQIVANVTMTPI